MAVMGQLTVISHSILMPTSDVEAYWNSKSLLFALPKGSLNLIPEAQGDAEQCTVSLVGTVNAPLGSWSKWVSESQHLLGERCSHLNAYR